MTGDDLVAGRSVATRQAGSILGGVVVATVMLTGLLLWDSPGTGELIGTLAAAAFYAASWGVAMGLFLRRQWRHLAPPALAHHVRQPWLPGPARGVLDAAVTGAAASLAAYVVVRATSDGSDLSDSGVLLGMVPGGLYGLSLATMMGAGELRRFEARHQLRLHVRIGGPRVAWTRVQARQRLVGVPLPSGTP